jgi:hypothetical protein
MNTTQEGGHPGGTPEGNEQHRRALGGSGVPAVLSHLSVLGAKSTNRVSALP